MLTTLYRKSNKQKIKQHKTRLLFFLGVVSAFLLAPGQVAEAGIPTAISAGGSHSCAIQNGAVYCWGNNTSGELGNGFDDFNGPGDAANTNVPVPALVLTSGATAINLGEEHSCAIQNGAAYCWGYATSGELGNGQDYSTGVEFSNVPVAVMGLGSGVTAISAGNQHSCAVMNGAAYCWGSNNAGALGDGTSLDSNVPVAVMGLGSGVTAISAARAFSCAIKNGAAYCWGSNFYGQLGDGTYLDSNVPVAVMGLGSGVTAIEGGFGHACAIKDGNVSCWGLNQYGQLGDGTNSDSNVPVDVVGLNVDMDVTTISAGNAHSCATKNGAALCWGGNGNVGGRLGDGTNSDSNVPVAVMGFGSGVTTIIAYSHTCALKEGAAYCWGRNREGQLGDGTNSNSNVPVIVQPFLTVDGVIGAGGGAVMDTAGTGAAFEATAGVLPVDTNVSIDVISDPGGIGGVETQFVDISLGPNPGPIDATITLPLVIPTTLIAGDILSLFKFDPATNGLIGTGIMGTVDLSGTTATFMGVFDFSIFYATLPPPDETQEVLIDINPGDPNDINLTRKGVIAVAVLTTSISDGEPADFDATQIDTSTVRFGPGEASIAHRKAHVEDVDGDGDEDLVVHFKAKDAGLSCGDTDGKLTGETFFGVPVQGTDSVNNVGC